MSDPYIDPQFFRSANEVLDHALKRDKDSGRDIDPMRDYVRRLFRRNKLRL